MGLHAHLGRAREARWVCRSSPAPLGRYSAPRASGPSASRSMLRTPTRSASGGWVQPKRSALGWMLALRRRHLERALRCRNVPPPPQAKEAAPGSDLLTPAGDPPPPKIDPMVAGVHRRDMLADLITGVQGRGSGSVPNDFPRRLRKRVENNGATRQINLVPHSSRIALRNPGKRRDPLRTKTRRRMKSPGGSRFGRECPEPAGGDSKTHVAAVAADF
jgi:hypothetical protein